MNRKVHPAYASFWVTHPEELNMKKVLLLGLAIVMTASLAYGQAGYLGVYMDTSGLECEFQTSTPNNFVPVHVVHHNTPGQGGSVFRVDYSPVTDGGGIWTGENSPYAVAVGSAIAGIDIGYSGCVAGPNHVLTISLLWPATLDPCTIIPVLNSLNTPSGEIEGSNCDFSTSFPNGFWLTVNPDQTCPPPPNCEPVPVNETTWGQVKSLYQ